MRERETRYYRSFDEDFAQTKNQDCKVPDDYVWVRRDLPFRFLSALIYGIALVFSNIYCRLFLHVKFKGAQKLRSERDTGCYIYGNHTMPVGDVFNPALAAFPKRIYTVVSPANLGIPVIGKLLPYLGALPISDTLHGMRQLNTAIECRLEEKKCVVIYPEAHMWEYCAFIRPFSQTAFKYPVKFPKPAYCMTATFRKRRFGRKPAVTIYIDGPFYAEGANAKEKAQNLCERIHSQMELRAQESDCEYIRYEKAAE